MADLFSASQKVALSTYLDHIHDTFARNIIVYKEAQKVVISTDPNYNHLYGNSGPTTSVSNVPVKKVFKARRRYGGGRALEDYGETDSQLKVSRVDASSQVRIKLKKADFEYIQSSKRIELDGRMFRTDSDPRAHGLFDVQFYTLFLRPIE